MLGRHQYRFHYCVVSLHSVFVQHLHRYRIHFLPATETMSMCQLLYYKTSSITMLFQNQFAIQLIRSKVVNTSLYQTSNRCSCPLPISLRVWFLHPTHITLQSEASDQGQRSQPQNLADIDWNCLLSKLLYLILPISNYQRNLFVKTIILIQVNDI